MRFETDEPGAFRLLVFLVVADDIVLPSGWLAISDSAVVITKGFVNKLLLLDHVDIHVADWVDVFCYNLAIE